MNNVHANEHAFIKGRVTIRTFRAGMVAAVAPLLGEISALSALPRTAERDAILNRAKAALESIKATYYIDTPVSVTNMVMASPGYGLDLIIQRLTGNNTYSLNVNYLELGIGTTAPTVNDTALTSPSIRLPISYTEDYGAAEAIIQAYVSDANLPNASYTEVGSFIDGTATIGTGQIFNHALVSPAYSKVAGQDTTVEVDFTIANA